MHALHDDPSDDPETPSVVLWVAPTGRVVRVLGDPAPVVGADARWWQAAEVGSWLAPRERERLTTLLDAGAPRSVVLGRRADGLPLALELHRLGTDDGATVLAARRHGGAVRWMDDAPLPPADTSGIDHVLSHDARGAVRHARNFFGLLRRDLPATEPDGDAPDFAAIVARSIDTADETVDRSVAFLRLADRPLTFRGITLGDLVALAHRMSVADRPGDDVVVTVEHPDVAVVAEPELLAQALAELLTNAREFATGAPVVIEGRPEEGWVDILVTDRGPGIPTDRAEDAFAPGRMLQARGDHPGTGMGLALCRRIGLRHGARVSIDPAMPGTTIRLAGLASAPPERVG